MVGRAVASIFSAFFALTAAHAELQLTAHEEPYLFEGMKLQRLAFEDDLHHVTYVPPKGWEYFGTPTKLTLRPKGKPLAEATVARFPIVGGATLDDSSIAHLISEALAAVPADSSNVRLLSQERNPVVITPYVTFMVTVSYTLSGADFCRSIIYMNRPKDQLRFQLISPIAQFKELQAEFLRSQLSWQNL